MAGEATGGPAAFEETQRAEPLLRWALGLLAGVCALPFLALSALGLATGGSAVDGTVLALAALLPAFVLVGFYVPLRAKRLHTTVTDEALVVAMAGLLFDRETRVMRDEITRIACWEEFGRLRALLAGFSGAETVETADRIHELRDAGASAGETTRHAYILRYRSAAPGRTYAGLVRIDRRSGSPVYVGSSRAGELTDAIVGSGHRTSSGESTSSEETSSSGETSSSADTGPKG